MSRLLRSSRSHSLIYAPRRLSAIPNPPYKSPGLTRGHTEPALSSTLCVGAAFQRGVFKAPCLSSRTNVRDLLFLLFSFTNPSALLTVHCLSVISTGPTGLFSSRGVRARSRSGGTSLRSMASTRRFSPLKAPEARHSLAQPVRVGYRNRKNLEPRRGGTHDPNRTAATKIAHAAPRAMLGPAFVSFPRPSLPPRFQFPGVPRLSRLLSEVVCSLGARSSKQNLACLCCTGPL